MSSEGMFDKAKDAVGGTEGLLDKAKDLGTDENIDKVAEGLKQHVPDQVDEVIDNLAEKAKKAND